MPYYLIKTYEEVSSFEALAVQLRIHKGSLNAIENHWASWNGKYKKQKRYDKVIFTSDTIEPVINALAKEHARIFRGRKFPV